MADIKTGRMVFAVFAAVGGAQDSATVTASVGSSWSITSYGTLSSSKVSIGSGGAITVTGDKDFYQTEIECPGGLMLVKPREYVEEN